MNKRDAELVVFSGLLGGVEHAVKAYESLNNNVLGRSTSARNTLTLPLPCNKQELVTLNSWGFTFDSERCGEALQCLWADKDPRRELEFRKLPLTFDVTAPEGWSVQPSDHWLYKHLVDPQGQHRGQLMIHYQDHDSWTSVHYKYSASYWQLVYNEESPIYPAILDSNRNIVWLGERMEPDPHYHAKCSEYYREYHAGRLPETACPPENVKDTARNMAALVLAKAAPETMSYAYFDVPAHFPPSESPIPVLKKYYYHNRLSNGDTGEYVDSGTEPFEAETDQSAVEIAKKRFNKTSRGYSIKAHATSYDGKTIWSDSYTCHRRKTTSRGVRYRHPITGCYHFTSGGHDETFETY